MKMGECVMGNIRFAMKALGVLVACVLAVGSSVSASSHTIQNALTYPEQPGTDPASFF